MKTVFDLKKIVRIEKALRTYDDPGKLYVVNDFVPGILWANSQRARDWGKSHIENFDFILAEREKCLFCSYSIGVGAEKLYLGSSIRPYSRLLVHFSNIYNNPAEWGLCYSDLLNPHFKLKVDVFGDKIYDETRRKKREYDSIKVIRPILMKADGTDEMIPLKDRRAAMKAAGVI